MLRKVFRRLLAIAIFAVFAMAYAVDLDAQQIVVVGANEVGGVVTSSKGPEAGVWIIAETTDLPTKFTRIVVTDDQGRYTIVDLRRYLGVTNSTRSIGGKISQVRHANYERASFRTP